MITGGGDILARVGWAGARRHPRYRFQVTATDCATRVTTGNLGTSLELRSDRPHKIYLKGPGYEPQLIVLEPRRGESGKTTLHPDRICVELVPVGVDRQLTLEVEEDGDALPGAFDADAATP